MRRSSARQGAPDRCGLGGRAHPAHDRARRPACTARVGCAGVWRVARMTPTTTPAADDRRGGDEEPHAKPRRQRAARYPARECRAGRTIVLLKMPTYRELLQQVKAEIDEVDAREAQAIDGAAWVDVREQDEWDEGHIPGAVHVPRGNLESRIEGVVPDRRRRSSSTAPPATARRSRRRRCDELGYEDVELARTAASPTGSATATRSSCRARSRPSGARATRATS